MRKNIILLVLLIFGAALSSCDYPEAGFFELAALNDSGKQLHSYPFMVEELVDDTDLTIGFNALLPRDGGLLVVPLENCTDFTRRSWYLRLADQDTRIGDMQLELTHTDNQFSFQGVLRPRDASQGDLFSGKGTAEIAGYVTPKGSGKHAGVKFSPALPSVVEGSKAARWELRRIDQAAFEKILGGKVAGAKRIEAAYLAPMFAMQTELPNNNPEETAEDNEEAGLRPGRFKKDEVKPGGGRVGP